MQTRSARRACSRASRRSPAVHSRSERYSAFLGVLCVVLGSASGVGADSNAETIVRWDGGHITVADVQTVVSQQLPSEKARLAREGVADLVERMLRYDLLVQEAERRGYAEHRNVVAAAKRKAGDLLIASVTVVDPKAIPQAEVERSRIERKAEWDRPEMRRASHIVVATRSEAEQLIQQLAHHTREDFARVAGERSLDAETRKQGGELGYFSANGKQARAGGGSVAPQLVAAAFAQAHVGAIVAKPVALPGGFSVVMLTGIQPAFSPKPAALEERIREQLAVAQQKAKLVELEERLRAEYRPVVHPELVDAIELPPATHDDTAGIPQGFPAFPPDPREPPKLIEPDDI